MRHGLVVAASVVACTACGASRFGPTTEASQPERQVSGCYAVHHRALNEMARWQRELDGRVDTLLLAEDLVQPHPGSLTEGSPPGRLLLWRFDDTTYISKGQLYSYWRLEGGSLT